MTAYSYGQQPSDLTARDLSLGWLSGVRHLKATSASGSYWHMHEAIQLLFCIKGEFAYEFRDRPQEVLTAGHFIVIPMGCEHRLAEAIVVPSLKVLLWITEFPTFTGTSRTRPEIVDLINVELELALLFETPSLTTSRASTAALYSSLAWSRVCFTLSYSSRLTSCLS